MAAALFGSTASGGFALFIPQGPTTRCEAESRGRHRRIARPD